MQGQTYLGAKVGRSKTASLRLADLQISLDDTEEPRQILQDLPVKNFNEKEQLRVRNEEQFPKWLFYLRHGFSMLLYGFGSKRQLLHNFAMSTLCDGGVLSIAGHSSNLTAKQIVIKALSMLQRRTPAELKGCSTDLMLQQIAKAPGFLYIILHNIDGLALRSLEAQGLLAELSACSNIALVASMDHVNTPLLWDKQMAARYNWLYFDVTTYAPYTVESASKPSLLVGRAEENTMQGAAIVLRTLVPNARRIFQILAEQQMQDPENGLSFHRLFKVCREKFLVSSEMTLRSHLTEFKDHQLIQIRRAPDGTDAIYIPLTNDTLTTVLTDMEVAE